MWNRHNTAEAPTEADDHEEERVELQEVSGDDDQLFTESDALAISGLPLGGEVVVERNSSKFMSAILNSNSLDCDGEV